MSTMGSTSSATKYPTYSFKTISNSSFQVRNKYHRNSSRCWLTWERLNLRKYHLCPTTPTSAGPSTTMLPCRATASCTSSKMKTSTRVRSCASPSATTKPSSWKTSSVWWSRSNSRTSSKMSKSQCSSNPTRSRVTPRNWIQNCEPFLNLKTCSDSTCLRPWLTWDTSDLNSSDLTSKNLHCSFCHSNSGLTPTMANHFRRKLRKTNSTNSSAWVKLCSFTSTRLTREANCRILGHGMIKMRDSKTL